MSVRRPARALAAAALAAVALAGCGADYPDLFVVERSGSLPGARLTLLVNDGGTVRCDRGEERKLPDALLLEARDIASTLAPDAQDDLALPRAPGTLLRYRLLMEQGTVTFGERDATSRPQLGRVVAFTRTVARDVCGLAR